MKKKIYKKFILNKNTVTHLNSEDQKKIKGGTTAFHPTCYCNTEHKSCSLQINCCPPAEKLDNDTLYYC